MMGAGAAAPNYAQMNHTDSMHSLGVGINNHTVATNPSLVMNMSSLGYPSIINNNIQGLSINYSNHIFQQAGPSDYTRQTPNNQMPIQ